MMNETTPVRIKLAIYASIFWIMLSCGNLPIYSGDLNPQEKNTLKVQYLGSSGFLLRYQEESIITAPFFSNFSVDEILFKPLTPDTQMINKYLPHADVSSILIGHAHYDHLIDIPYIALKKYPKATLFGNVTAQNILASVIDSNRVKTLNRYAATHEKEGKWFYSPQKHFRFMPLFSEHAPHIGNSRINVKLYQGKITEPLSTLPQKAEGWKEGQSFAFLIDVLDKNKTPIFRIHFQDAASNFPFGIPPASVLKSRAVDLALVCVPGYFQVKHYPETLIETLTPKHVLLSHWEDFFSPYTQDIHRLKAIPFLMPQLFINKLKKSLQEHSEWKLPKPGSVMYYEIGKEASLLN